MRFHVYRWCNYDKQLTMLILNEDDIENESDEHAGASFEILILPSKYKNIYNQYLNTLRMLVDFRDGEIIYV